ncbi:MAG: DUF177 domain-containing protein [Beijerinckiaceae bacterium]|nr:DUF177 domain-containing protein [Beijerinckiaceae bacterium]
MTSKSDSRPRTAGVTPEAGRFSRMLGAETVPDCGLDIEICASEAERASLAAQCSLASVQSLEANFHVTKQGRGRITVSGGLKARVTQLCVVSLEPFETGIEAGIGVDFAPSGSLAPAASSTQGDPPDPIVNGQIDLGALAAEFLMLNLELYPRKPGAVFEEAGAGAGGVPGEKDSPFAVLLRR